MNRFLSILLFCFCISCGNTLIKKPDNLLSKNTMVDIYYDLAIINAANNTNVSALAEYNLEAMPYIYAKFKIDSTQLMQSSTYYASDPSKYEEIYAKVKERLESKQKILEDIAQKKADSLKNLREQKIKRANKEKEKAQKLKDTLPNTSGK